MVCGTNAARRYFPGLAAAWLAWVLFLPLLGPLTFWSYFLFVGRSPRRGGFPFCDRHIVHWPRRGLFVVVGLAVTIGLIALAIALRPPVPLSRVDKPHWLFAVIGCWILVFLMAVMMLNSRAMRPIGGNSRYLVMSGVSRRFADAVEVRKLELNSTRQKTSPRT